MIFLDYAYIIYYLVSYKYWNFVKLKIKRDFVIFVSEYNIKVYIIVFLFW